MKHTLFHTILSALLLLLVTDAMADVNPCDSFTVTRLPGPTAMYSPDSSLYLINKLDKPGKKGVFQVYIGHRGDKDSVLTCISLAGPNGKKRSFRKLNKLQVQWHSSGKFI